MGCEVTLSGNLIKLEGNELKVGDKAPNFKLSTLQNGEFKELTLNDFSGRVLVLCTVLSLSTSVCNSMLHRLNEEAKKLSGVSFLVVSMDLPFVQSSFLKDNKIDNVITASDHMDCSFSKAYGVLIPALRCTARAVFVISPEGVIKHVEYVPEIATEPDYETAINSANSLLNI